MNTRKEIVNLKLGTQAVLSKTGDIDYLPVIYTDFSGNVCRDKNGKKKKNKMSGVITSMSLALRKAVVFPSAETAFSQAVTVRTFQPAGWVTDFHSH